MDVGTRAQQVGGEGSAGDDQMLAVVQHEQEALGLQRLYERLPDQLAPLLLDAQHTGDGLGHEGGVGQCG